MPSKPQWHQPPMFPPEDLPSPSITVDLTVHLEGPEDRCQVWVTIRDPRQAGALSIQSYEPVRLDAGELFASTVLVDAMREARLWLLPF